MVTVHVSSKPLSLAKMGKQSGAILVMFTIGLFSLLAVAALALDGGHLLVNKGRLQNAVDASALYAAKILQNEGSLYDAREAATQILVQNLGFTDNGELKSSVELSSPDYNSTQVTSNIYIEFSVWPDPFIPVFDDDSKYVRVRIENVRLNNFFAQILNFDKKIRASAVAGKSTDIECLNKILPMMVCGLNSDPDYINPDTDEKAPFGLSLDTLYVMKTGSNQGTAIGPGNFQLLRLNGGSGGADIRRALAGEFTPGECVGPGDEVDTEPGNTVGPVTQGLNTRFGRWKGGGMNSDEHPRDLNTCQGDRVQVDNNGAIIPFSGNNAEYSHADYLAGDEINHCDTGDITSPSSIATAGRRELPIVIGLCDGMTNGANTITALGFGCFFLTQEISKKGNEAHVIGEFVRVCSNSGSASLDPLFMSNSSTIVLYRDPNSPDS
ncbi:Tad domain-containing protein [Shewanella surugensis]|uniref:Tad domain-containing protein n=1 Tax=Shewanella surugensis TaxID=212020 RepID=A0ABT0LJL3_9GAMM|nr:Tad domain-containing protein [Shewanella surugensis]MCL1127311.1 Tad domain-containing protein [Shewanella surugensis]